MGVENGNILRAGENCWRMDHARRAAFLIDGQAFFSAFHQAARKAKRSIFIASWDIDSRAALLRDNKNQRDSTRLGAFLNRLAAEKPDLEINILAWDFAMIYALEREGFPIFKLGLNSHERIKFKMDGEHPLGASHHQKLVVIDDDLAFAGGLDLTKWRWDTPEHAPGDPRRVDPEGKPYLPFHDVQIVVQGDAAASLGRLFRRRWLQASGKRLEVEPPKEPQAWPDDLAADLEDIQVAVARTEPAYKGRPEVREVEVAFLDSIAAARDYIYWENQYFTSHSICQALIDRLERDDCPEIILVMPQRGPDWLEQATMDALRWRVLKRLSEADRHGRIRFYYPARKGVGGGVKLHSKVMVVDDRLIRVGSANLSNRSMGLDTECDLLIETHGAENARKAAGLRNRLLAEHLGAAPGELEEAWAEKGSLLEAVEALRGGERTLEPLEPRAPAWVKSLDSDPKLLDPEQPVELEQLIESFAMPGNDENSPWRRWLKWVGLGMLVMGLAVAWRWGPLSEWVDINRLAAWASSLRENSWAPAAVMASYVLGGALMFPVMVLIGATALIFDPWLAAAYAMAGSLSSAIFSYGVGYQLGKESVREMAGHRLNRVSRELARRGLATMIIVHLLPMAPFSVVNMAAGAFHVKLRHFALGTFIGMAPGIISITVFADQLRSLASDPDWVNWAILAGLALLLILVGLITKRFLTTRSQS